MGQDQDLLSTMSPDYFLQTTRSQSQYDYSSLEQLDKQYVYSMVCENPHLRLGVNMQHRRLPQLELSLNMLGIFNRIDEVAFATPDKYWGDEDFQYLSMSVYTNEIGIEPALSDRLQGGAFALIGSVGANAAYIFDGTLDIYGHNLNIAENRLAFRDDGTPNGSQVEPYIDEYLTMRNGFSTRAFASLGGSITFLKRLELGAQLTYGLGKRFINLADPVNTELRSFSFRAAWVLR